MKPPTETGKKCLTTFPGFLQMPDEARQTKVSSSRPALTATSRSLAASFLERHLAEHSASSTLFLNESMLCLEKKAPLSHQNPVFLGLFSGL